MKILVITNLYPPDVIGGYELGCSQVVEALQTRGHEVRVLTSAPRMPVAPTEGVLRTLQLADMWDTEFMDRLSKVTLNHHFARAKFLDAYNVYQLIEVLEAFRPDIVYLWNLIGLGGLGIFGTLQHLEIPWVWHLMDDVPLVLCGLDSGIIPVIVREFERQSTGRFLACSQRLVNEIEAGGLALKSRTEVVPNWVRGERPPDRPYYHGGHLRIVTAANLTRHKGIHLIIEAASQLLAWGYENFSVDLYGNLTDTKLEGLVYKFGLTDFVKLKGFRVQKELWELYSGYDVFILPTWEREPFAFAPLEASAHGCVPLISWVCGNAEWFVNDVHCLKAERTADAFATRLSHILDGKIDLEPLGRRVAATVWRDFHLDSLICHIERNLEEVAEPPGIIGGRGDDIYRMAVLAEKLLHLKIEESHAEEE